MRTRSDKAFYGGIPPLIVALGISITAYSLSRYHNYLIFLNMRFALGVLAAVVAGAFAWAAGNDKYLLFLENRVLKAGLRVIVALFSLALLSCEAYSYCLEAASSRRKGRWAGLVSLSVVWGLNAVIWLALGFWRKVREYRLAALGLLAVVALKVVLVDMAAVKQIYRIISFVVLGLMMISASYLYHRLEKRLGDMSGEGE